MLARIIIGLIITAVGFGMVKWPEVALDFLGDSEIATRFFSGGNINFYKFIGVVVCLVGLLVTTNIYTKIIEWGLNFLY